MGKYKEKILDTSVWITATPTELAKTLPFYITEAGYFIAEKDYKVQRETHDSFLILYTIHGQGFLQTGHTELLLQQEDAILIDCHSPHKYYSLSDEWEFLWIHFDGISAKTMFHILYPTDTICPVHINQSYKFEYNIKDLISKTNNYNITDHIDISSKLHYLINIICSSALECISDLKTSNNDIRIVLDFIENNYARQITIEDMTQDIPISKYHFIRLFRRIMGITPYQYLTNYRINMSKKYLHSTNNTVAEISELCGFLDTSNFITHFKKHTGQRPLQYRHDFL